MLNKNKQDLKKYIVYLLSRREYSKFELLQKLKKFSDNDTTINSIINEFSSKNLQSDIRFCENFIHAKKNKYGTLKITYELNNKGIDRNLYDKLLPLPEEELIIAKNILHNKYKNIIDNVPARKQINFLISKGFNYEIAIKAVKFYQKND